MSSETICLNCGEPIKRGRSDKKFCSPGCKDTYYNTLKSAEQKEIGRIDIILKRNRRVLKKLYNPRKEETVIDREILVREGFEFDFHTHHVITRIKSSEFIFCFDFGYRETEKGKYRIIRSFG